MIDTYGKHAIVSFGCQTLEKNEEILMLELNGNLNRGFPIVS